MFALLLILSFIFWRRPKVIVKSSIKIYTRQMMPGPSKLVKHVPVEKTVRRSSFINWLIPPPPTPAEPRVRIYGRLNIVIHDEKSSIKSVDKLLLEKGFVRQDRIYSGFVTGNQGQAYEVQLIKIGPNNWMLRIRNPPQAVFTGRKGACFEFGPQGQFLRVNFAVGKDLPHKMLETLENYIREVGAP